jgi:hypothetical protein
VQVEWRKLAYVSSNAGDCPGRRSTEVRA